MTSILTIVVLIVWTAPSHSMKRNAEKKKLPARKSRRLSNFHIPRISTAQGVTQSFEKSLESEAEVNRLIEEATRRNTGTLTSDGSYTICSMAIDNDHYGENRGEGHTFLVKHEGDVLYVYDGHEDHYFNDDSDAWRLYRHLLSSIQRNLGCTEIEYVDPESLFSSEQDIQEIRRIRDMDEGGCYLLAKALEDQLYKMHDASHVK